ncbi:MAG: PAS domain S-box protein [Desulfobacterota bacterium]|nr:PAS domain S-box protein [Thermodesulfobacteriota bacterium]
MKRIYRTRSSGFLLIALFILASAAVIAVALIAINRSGYAAGGIKMLRVCLEAALLICLFGFLTLILWWRRQMLLYKQLYEYERRCQEINARYETIFQHANDIIMIADENMKIVAANERALAAYGYTREEMIGMPVALLRPSATRGDIEGQFSTAQKQGSHRFETLAMKKDGTVFPIQSSVRALTFDDRTFYVGIIQDVTERQRAEEALQQAKREWEEIFQAIGNPTFILDPDNGIVNANRAIQRALGMTEEQIKGKKCYEVLHRSDHPPAECPLAKMMASNQTEASEMEVETLGGTYLVTCTPMFDASGRLSKAIHIAADITRVKQALKEAQESKQRFLALATSAQDAIVITDAEGIIVFWNAAAEQMFGFSADEALGQSCELYMPEDVRQQYRRSRDLFLATGRPRFIGKKYKSTALRKDGMTFPVEGSTSTWMENGKRFFASFVRDITERENWVRKIETQLEELRQWQRVAVGREERMVELKQEVNELLERLGLPPRYPHAGEKREA